MIKMVVTDLDDTLLRTDKTISPYTMGVIKEVRQRGIKVIYATARGISTKNLLDDKLFDGRVLLNGAEAFIGDELIYQRTIEPAIFTPFLKELSARNFKVAAEIGGIHYANYNVQEKWSYKSGFVFTDFEEVTGGAEKLYAIIEAVNRVDELAAILPPDLYMHVSRDNLAMFMHKEARKIKGIAAVAKGFNICKSKVVTFGDDINDKEMLQGFGLGIAMGNAISEVKAVADQVCASNDNDGVAKWLAENILAGDSKSDIAF